MRNKYDYGIALKQCAKCGKEFATVNLDLWQYKIKRNARAKYSYYCSYTCWRSCQKDKKKRADDYE